MRQLYVIVTGRQGRKRSETPLPVMRAVASACRQAQTPEDVLLNFYAERGGKKGERTGHLAAAPGAGAGGNGRGIMIPGNGCNPSRAPGVTAKRRGAHLEPLLPVFFSLLRSSVYCRPGLLLFWQSGQMPVNST